MIMSKIGESVWMHYIGGGDYMDFQKGLKTICKYVQCVVCVYACVKCVSLNVRTCSTSEQDYLHLSMLYVSIQSVGKQTQISLTY